MINSDIESWVAPSWHPDFGDPQRELDLLKAFCRRLLQEVSGLSVTLECLEDGYMKVVVQRGAELMAEVFVVERGEANELCLCMPGDRNKEELYFSNIEQGIQAFRAD